MARAAFIMDRMMHKIGLHGKSFIPLLIGFGCNVPAIMATRTLESRRDRIMTMLITPFMSCSARLPVYILLVSAFFPVNQGLILLSVYLIGILLAIGTSFLLKKTLFAKSSDPFVRKFYFHNVTVHQCPPPLHRFQGCRLLLRYSLYPTFQSVCSPHQTHRI